MQRVRRENQSCYFSAGEEDFDWQVGGKMI